MTGSSRGTGRKADPKAVALAAERLARIKDSDLTVADGIDRVMEAYKGREYLRNMQPHLALLEATIGHMPMLDVEWVHLEIVRQAAVERAMEKPWAKHGKGAARHFTHAASALFRASAAVVHHHNPVSELPSLGGSGNPRSALPPAAVGALFSSVVDLPDPALAQMMGHFSIEAGARNMGLTGLRLIDLREAPFVTLVEKNGDERRVPIDDTLRRALLHFAVTRGATQWDDPVFLTSHGKPLTSQYIGDVMRQWRAACLARGFHEVPAGFSHHWLRHTAINNYVHVGGLALASHFAGHVINGVFGTTGLYTTVGDAQLIPVCERLHGETRDSGDDWTSEVVSMRRGRLLLATGASRQTRRRALPAGP